MFRTRLLSAIVLIALLVGIIIAGGYVLLGGVLILSLVAYRELMKAFGLSGVLKGEAGYSEKKNFIGCFSGIELIGYAGILTYLALMYFTENKVWLLLTITGTLIAYMFVYVFTFPKYKAEDLAKSFFCFIYGGVLISFWYLLRELEYGFILTWLVFIWSSLSDTGAYCVGVLFGKHKLAPELSPKKSIEGAVGGVVVTAICGGIYALLVLEPQMGISGVGVTIAFIIASAIGSMVSQVGDLMASAIKRNQGIKDYGKIIPGHGGVMDRIDSIIAVVPIVYLLSIIILERM